MTPDEAVAHKEHQCDVFTDRETLPKEEDEHIGVIGKIHKHAARVEGHPLYPARWFNISDLTTSCKIPISQPGPGTMKCELCGGPAHRDDAMNQRCNRCERIVRICECLAPDPTPNNMEV